jgi:peptide/nickel transport system substrate-binding protein
MVSRWLAISSLIVAMAVQAATRPHYGGVLRVETSAVVQSVQAVPGDAASEKILGLIGDTLVGLDASAKPVPRLATAWQSDNGNKRWQFSIRPGVFLHNGASLTPAHVAQALAAANANWKVRAGSEAVTIDCELPLPDLPLELARPAYAVVLRDSDQVIGTGAFRLESFQAGRRVVLRANDDYWGGRPYVDSIEIALGKPLREQAVDLQLGRADVVETSPEQARRTVADARKVMNSWPSELIAIEFAHGSGPAEDPRLRQAISLAMDRSAIHSVLLQRQGDPAGGLLPQWVSGYSYLFSVNRDLARARELRSQVPAAQAAVVLGYEPGDELARSIAERVALNARDAGINIQVAPGNGAATIVRVPVAAASAKVGLSALVGRLDPGEVSHVLAARSPEELYAAERDVLEQWRVVPIAHVPQAVSLGTRVRNWWEPREGGWPVADVWLEGATR